LVEILILNFEIVSKFRFFICYAQYAMRNTIFAFDFLIFQGYTDERNLTNFDGYNLQEKEYQKKKEIWLSGAFKRQSRKENFKE
jgi:hypothetical protein